MKQGFASAIVAAVLISCSSASSTDLNDVHNSIEERYSEIGHIAASDFLTLSRADVVLFDVREKQEYDVSHIPGAVWVNPSISPKEFLEQYGDQIAGKDMVFYCSVGERSSRLAGSVHSSGDGQQEIYNLEKGIFGWHNEKRELISAGEATDLVHPYNETWGQLVERQNKISYK